MVTILGSFDVIGVCMKVRIGVYSIINEVMVYYILLLLNDGLTYPLGVMPYLLSLSLGILVCVYYYFISIII